MAGSREELLLDKDWYEVNVINSYAVLMGYISMAIKGLGFLVLTWTTVVLLGGFVSSLLLKDFWCLAFITLIQMAGVFDAVMNEKLRYIGFSPLGIVVAFLDFTEKVEDPSQANLGEMLLAIFLVFVQLVILAAVLFPLAIIYMFGILISGGISLWRLIEHDYSNSDGDEASNLTPAMDTLYCLALIQCVVFCYRFMLKCIGKRLAKHVVREGDPSEMKVFSDYLQETRTGCEKDPAFSDGRNLVTYAVDMIGSRSLVDRIYGVMILYTSINNVEMKLNQLKDKDKIKLYRQRLDGQTMQAKHLLLSESSRDILQKLLEALDSRGLHGRESRHQAAKIVDRLIAFDLKLEQFPGAIEHISSMIGTFEEYSIAEPYQQDCLFHVHEQDWDLHARCLPPSHWDDSTLHENYEMLLERGLFILRKLAFNENNCRVMSDTRGLVSKIMAPVACDLLHNTTDDHGECNFGIVILSMEVMVKLAGASGETGAKLRHEILSCKEAVSTMERILGCNGCGHNIQLLAMQILTQLHMDTTEGQSISADFVRKLVDIFTDDNNYSSVRGYAGQELSKLCFLDGSNAILVIQTGGGYVVDSLCKVLLDDKDETCNQRAAEILEHLCTHYTKDDQYLGKLKKSMNDMVPKVIENILLCMDKTHTGTDRPSKAETDLENQCDNSQGNGIGSSSQEDDQDEEKKAFQTAVQSVKSANLLSSLLSLCVTVHDKFISDLAPHLGASSFLNKLKQIVLEKREDPKVENLLLIKIVMKVVISIMKHCDGAVAKQKDLGSLIDALSSAWKNNMLDLDYSMVFSSGSSNRTSSKLDRCTLASLVKETEKLHAKLSSTSGTASS